MVISVLGCFYRVLVVQYYDISSGGRTFAQSQCQPLINRGMESNQKSFSASVNNPANNESCLFSKFYFTNALEAYFSIMLFTLQTENTKKPN